MSRLPPSSTRTDTPFPYTTLFRSVGLSRRQNVYPSDVALIFPVASMGNKRKYHITDQQPVSAETMLAKEKWKKVSWRRGTKGRLTCLFAARSVRVADGHRHRMIDRKSTRLKYSH